MIQTTLPELNDILGGGFPNPGLTMIVGAARSGKTSLAVNIISVALQDPASVVAVVSDTTAEAWDRLLAQYPGGRRGVQRFYRTSNAFGVSGMTLIVLDGGDLTKPIWEYSRRGPVILTSNERNSGLLKETQQADMILRLDRVEDATEACTIARLVKDREGVSTLEVPVALHFDRQRGLVPQGPAPMSKWDRLMGEDLI